MAHPLERVIREAEGFVLIGESAADRFPAYSYFAYTVAEKRFYCLDLDGLPEARGKAAGGVVYARVEDLPAERGDLAVIWVTPARSVEAVEVAHAAGCRRVWFSFATASSKAVARAEELEMEVVEIGRCPIYYLDKKPAGCAAHTALVKLSGTYRRPPRTRLEGKRPREIF